MHVLAVCDSQELRLLIEQCVSALGHIFIHVPNAQAALDYSAEHGVNMLIADLGAPAVGTLESLEKIRRCGKEWFPVIFLTDKADAESCNKDIFAGGDAYLAKPISLPLLHAQIGALESIYRRQLAFLTAHRELQVLMGVAHVAEMIRAAMQNCRIPHAQSKIADCVTLSLGCVTHAGLAEDVETLLKAADDALYIAKEQGRNRFVRA